jgi:hypothetical protein
MMTTHRTYKLGKSRDQASFLPPSLEDYVGRDSPVRAIDAYVDSLDLNDLSFWDVNRDGDGYFIKPLFVSVTPSITLTDHDGNLPAERCHKRRFIGVCYP